jgi:hypothetical protein
MIAVAAVLLVALAALTFVHFRETPAPQPLTRFSVDLGPELAVLAPVKIRQYSPAHPTYFRGDTVQL